MATWKRKSKSKPGVKKRPGKKGKTLVNSLGEKQQALVLLSMKLGRTTGYSPELGEEIAHLIAADPRPIHVLCAEEESWPGLFALYQWEELYPEFKELLRVAKRSRADVLVTGATLNTESIKQDSKFGTQRIAKQRLVNQLTEVYAQRLSRDYATRTQHELSGPGGETAVPVDFTNMNDQELRELIALQRKAAGGK